MKNQRNYEHLLIKAELAEQRKKQEVEKRLEKFSFKPQDRYGNLMDAAYEKEVKRLKSRYGHLISHFCLADSAPTQTSPTLEELRKDFNQFDEQMKMFKQQLESARKELPSKLRRLKKSLNR